MRTQERANNEAIERFRRHPLNQPVDWTSAAVFTAVISLRYLPGPGWLPWALIVPVAFVVLLLASFVKEVRSRGR